MAQTNQPTTDATRNRLAGTVFLAQSFFSASTIAAFTLSPIIAAELAGSEAAAGFPNTITLVGRALFAYPFGYLMDRIGRRYALSGGYFMAFVGAIISFWAVVQNSYLGFLLGALLIGMSRSAGDQSRFIAAEVYPTKRRARVIGVVVFAGTIGAIFGPLLVPPSTNLMTGFELPGNSGPFIVSAVAMLLATVVTFLFLYPDPGTIARQIDDEESKELAANGSPQAEKRPLGEIFRKPMVILSILSMGLGFFVMTFLMVITPLHMAHHNHTTEGISSVIFWHTFGMFGLSFMTGYLIDRFGQIKIIYGGTFILVASCIVAPLSVTLPVLWLALFLLGLGWNFTFIGGSSLLTDALTASERAQTQGAAEALVSIMSGLASFTVGFAFEQGDYWLVSMIGLGFTLILLAGTYILPRLDPPLPPTQNPAAAD
ncbi:MAG: MFS transporter [Ardenticatenaceae bacterium]|nr:MFS transporter [Ardenticatenaceae bacterium]